MCVHASAIKQGPQLAGCLCNFLLGLADLTKEAQQLGVDFFRVRPRDAVWAILHDELARPLDKLGSAQSRSRDGEDAVGVPLNHQRGHIDAGQVRAEVFVPGCNTREAGGGGGSGCDVPAGPQNFFADALTQEHVGVVEIIKEGQ